MWYVKNYFPELYTEHRMRSRKQFIAKNAPTVTHPGEVVGSLSGDLRLLVALRKTFHAAGEKLWCPWPPRFANTPCHAYYSMQNVCVLALWEYVREEYGSTRELHLNPDWSVVVVEGKPSKSRYSTPYVLLRLTHQTSAMKMVMRHLIAESGLENEMMR